MTQALPRNTVGGQISPPKGGRHMTIYDFFTFLVLLITLIIVIKE